MEAAAATLAGGWGIDAYRSHPAVKFFLDRLNQSSSFSLEQVLTAMSESLRALTRSDFAFCVLYDSILGFCRPRGLSGSSSVLRRFLENVLPGETIPYPVLDALRRRDDFLSRLSSVAATKATLADLAVADEYRLQMALLHKAVASELMPRRDGVSWMTFTDSKEWDSLRDQSTVRRIQPPPLLARLNAEAVVKPFRCQPDADPLGVVWVGRIPDDHRYELKRARERKAVVAPEDEGALQAIVFAAASLASLLKFQAFKADGSVQPIA
jgi:hypothetical protein